MNFGQKYLWMFYEIQSGLPISLKKVAKIFSFNPKITFRSTGAMFLVLIDFKVPG